MSDPKLKPCPFCGGEATQDWYDRGGTIGCKNCGYKIPFKGLLRTDPNDKPIPYRHSDGTIGPAREGQTQEYYWPRAHEEAIAAWNRRAPVIGREALSNLIQAYTHTTGGGAVINADEVADAILKRIGCGHE